MHQVTCLGELLIDFTSLQPGASLSESSGFEKHAGGAPANVAVGVCRLGGSACFLGMVGDDEFGRFLAQELASRGVETGGLRYSTLAHTTLAFVALRADGEREFIFYRNPGADMLFGPADLDEGQVTAGQILHHGSISFISPANRAATLRAITLAKAHGRLISYDPNLRLNLWPDAGSAYAGILLGLQAADVLKVSEEELAFITGEAELDAGLRQMRAQGIPAVVVTRGAQGCRYAWGEHWGALAAPAVTAIDTTGAGDAFVAGMLTRLARLACPVEALTRDEVEALLTFATRVAARVVTRRGAIPAMPTLDEVESV
jgi:fructokinase